MRGGHETGHAERITTTGNYILHNKCKETFNINYPVHIQLRFTAQQFCFLYKAYEFYQISINQASRDKKIALTKLQGMTKLHQPNFKGSQNYINQALRDDKITSTKL